MHSFSIPFFPLLIHPWFTVLLVWILGRLRIGCGADTARKRPLVQRSQKVYEHIMDFPRTLAGGD